MKEFIEKLIGRLEELRNDKYMNGVSRFTPKEKRVFDIAEAIVNQLAEEYNKESVKTNADRIRSMSDKELGEFLCDISKCESGYCPAYDTCMKTEHGTMKKWLQSEVE